MNSAWKTEIMRLFALINCEQMDGYDPIQEFFSFHDNKHKMVRKSIYYRKYLLDKIIFNLTKKYGIMITRNKKIRHSLKR